ncbi:MAG TPA: ABC transporter permease [Acidobacteriota bacterium]|nr:ABC transporter permease [Acidobacteriota bacterium]
MNARSDRRPQVPGWTEALLSRHLPARLSSEVLGDFEEELLELRLSWPARHLWCLRQASSVLFHSLLGKFSSPGRLPKRRGDSFMNAFGQDFRIAFRKLARRPVVSFLALLTLALGIGANSAIYSVVYAVMLKPSPYPNAERTLMLGMRGEDSSVSFRECRQVLDKAATLEKAGCYSGWTVSLSGDDDAVLLRAAAVYGDFFEVLGQPALLGRLPSAQELERHEERPVVISSQLWRTRFAADSSVIGREVLLDGSPATIVGVLPDSFEIPNPGVQAWFPLRPFQEQGDYRRYRYLDVLGLRRSETGPQAVRQEIEALEMGMLAEVVDSPQEVVDWTTTVTPLSAYQSAQARPLLNALWAAAGFVLLIACANVANLQLSRASARQREITLRRALGAGRLRLLRQLLVENVLLAVSGGALGLAVAYFAVNGLRRFLPAETPRVAEIALDHQVLLFTLAVSLAAGLLFGLAPALRLSRRRHFSALGAGRTLTADLGQERLSRLLVVAETALGLVLVVGAGLMVQTLHRLTSVDPGFGAQGVIRMELSVPRNRYPEQEEVVRFFQRAMEEVRNLPQVEEAGLVHLTPFTGYNWGSRLEIEGRTFSDLQEQPMTDWQIADSGYFRAMRIPLLQGRTFDPRDIQQGATPVTVINHALAQTLWPGESALGKRIRSGQEGDVWVTVVGVVGNVRHHGLDQPPLPEMYRPLGQRSLRGMHAVALASGPLEGAIPAIRDTLRQLDPQVPVSHLAPLEEKIQGSMRDRSLMLGLLGSFALLALLLGAVGIYGVFSDGVARRLPELSIRMALGASPSHLKRRVVSQGLRTALAGVVLGLAAALGLSRLLEGHLFQTDPHDPLLLASLSIFLLLVSAAACYLPARRASRTDPLQVLRDV